VHRVGLAVVALLGCGRLRFDELAPRDGSLDGSPGDGVAALTPFAYWKFDEGAGTQAMDSSGNGHTMMLVNGMAWAAGMFGGAIHSSGTTEYGFVPVLDFSQTDAVTVSLWANRTYSNANSHTLFESTTDASASAVGFGVYPDDTNACGAGGGLNVFLKGDVGFNGNCFPQPSSGVWHHLVVVFDKSQTSFETTLYVDGAVQTRSAGTMADNTNMFAASPFYVLSRAGTLEFNAGSIDDLKIFTRALTPSEIAGL
jgi:hypothetical protein